MIKGFQLSAVSYQHSSGLNLYANRQLHINLLTAAWLVCLIILRQASLNFHRQILDIL